MDPRVLRRIQRSGWDLAADRYVDAWAPRLAPAVDDCVHGAALAPGETVLDLACGPGPATLLAARLVGEHGHVVAQDLSRRMVELTRAAVIGARLGNTVVECSDMEATGLPDARFDAVLCAFGLMYAADRSQALREVARVLRPRGRVSACVWGARERCGFAEVFPIVDRRVSAASCPLFFSLGAPSALRFALERAGFADVTEHRSTLLLRWSDGPSAARDAFEGGHVALPWSRFAPSVKREVAEEYVASLARFRTNDGYAVPGEVVQVCARLPG